MLSSEWMDYLTQQVEKNATSSAVDILGFNWSEQLLEYIAETTFNVHKYRSAIFYLNYSVRQVHVDVDGIIGRKQSLLDAKLRKMDAHPGVAGFMQDMLSSQGGDKK